MAKQDNWVRITVRIPPELHQRLTESCVLENRSLNAEIVERLEDGFSFEGQSHVYRDLNEDMRLTRLNLELLKAAIEMPSREEILKRMAEKKLEPMSPEGYQAYLMVTAEKQRVQAENERREAAETGKRPSRWK